MILALRIVSIIGLVIGLVLALLVIFTLHEITYAGTLACLGSATLVATSALCLIFTLKSFQRYINNDSFINS